MTSARRRQILRLSAFLAAVLAISVLVVRGLYLGAPGPDGSAPAPEPGAVPGQRGPAPVADGPRILEVNGHPIHLATGSTDESVGEVLEARARSCGMGAPAGSPPPSRAGGERSGYVACFSQLDADEAAALGGEIPAGRYGVRLLFAEAGLERTRVIRLWTEGPLPLEEMLPAAGDAPGGDAPGEDARGVPRPPRSRRLFSVGEAGHPQRANHYASEASVGEAESFYRARLAALGWTLLETRSPPATEGGRVLTAAIGSTLAVVVLDPAEEGSSVTVLTTSL